MWRRRGLSIAAAMSAALLMTACGSSSSSSSSTTSPATSQTSGSVSAAAAGGGSSSGATYKVAVMGIFSGANYVKGQDNSIKMAIDEVNGAGGIGGKQVEFKEFDTGITPQGAVNATNLALQWGPSAFVGYGVSAGLKASIGAINSAGIPVLHGTLASLTSPDSLGSKLTFRVEPTTAQFAAAADSYLFGTLGVKSLTIINTQDSAPTEGAKYIGQDASKAGVTVISRAVSPEVTDLTEPIQAAKGSGAIWNWGYATTDALTVKTAAQNDLNIPIMTFSVGTAARNNLIPASLLTEKILQVSPCAPAVLETPAAKKYTAAFTAKFGKAPNDSSYAGQYDSIYLLKTAAADAGSTDPAKVAAALATISYDGVCGTEKADANHNMLHSLPIIKFTGGVPTLVKEVTDLVSPF